MAGIKLTQVPFKGGAETNAAVLGQHTMLQADSTGWTPLVDAGKLRLLMVWTAERSPELPRRADAEGARLSHGLRLAVRHRRTEGHGPQDRRQAARRLQEGDRGSGRDRDAGQIRHGAELQDTEDYQKFVGEMIESRERKAIDKLGLAKKTN